MEMAASLGVYREAKADKWKIERKAAQAKWAREKRAAQKEKNGPIYKAVKKTNRRRMRASRADLKEIGLKETPKSERVS